MRLYPFTLQGQNDDSRVTGEDLTYSDHAKCSMLEVSCPRIRKLGVLFAAFIWTLQGVTESMRGSELWYFNYNICHKLGSVTFNNTILNRTVTQM